MLFWHVGLVCAVTLTSVFLIIPIGEFDAEVIRLIVFQNRRIGLTYFDHFTFVCCGVNQRLHCANLNRITAVEFLIALRECL